MVLTASNMRALGAPAPDFALSEPATGRVVRRDDFKTANALLIVFMCNHCPYVKHLKPALAKLALEYRDHGLAMVGINSNDSARYPDDGPEQMKREVESFGYTFPYLFDDSQDVARAFDAACTPDFFLFDAQRKLVYRGQFDDSRPNNGKPATGADLRAAINALLANKTPEIDQKPSVGCNIKWKD